MEIRSLEVNKETQQLIADLSFDRNAVGESMTLSIHQSVTVKLSRGVNKSKRVYSRDFRVSSARSETLRIPLKDINAYTYSGHDISMSTEVQLSKTTSMLSFFSKQKQPVKLGFFSAPAKTVSAAVMIEPPDTFNLFKNIKVLSGSDKLYFLSVCILAVFIVSANSLIGWHDQNSAVGSTYFYSHYNSDGEKQLPLFNAMAFNVALIGMFGYWLKKILRRYMSFRLVGKLGEVTLGKRYSLGRMLRGRSRIDLEGCELRVVACNVELGQYVTGSGKKRRTHSFQTPVKCISIYKKKLDRIPKEEQIRRYLKDDICFDEVYQHLAPNCTVSKTHGVKLHWEVQLLHPELVDQEVVGASDGFYFGHFILD